MKFKKIFIIGVDQNKLDSEYWDKIKNLAEIIKQEIFIGNMEAFLTGKPQNVVD